ncbi:MAG TPA: serine/threonine-protein kinase [Gemmatimonadaceae bacterium]|nr:serine/threonine-protein kinase [Gemmatimonadaceae bacterium]
MTMRCPRCGTTYGDDVRVCERDGAALVAPAGPPTLPPSAIRPPLPPPRSRAIPPVRPAAGRAPGAPPSSPPPSSPPARDEWRPARQPAVPRHGNLVGELLDGRYRIERKVGEGGMSFVYLAHEEGTGTRYAIKVLSPTLSEEQNAMARLRREAGLGSRLAHPNVCHIVRLGETPEGLVYVVMPYIDGELLADRTHRLGHLPLAQVVAWVGEMAAGLDVAHKLGIVHRDLKPENVMICTRPDGTEYAVVMDFGLAKERRTGPELEKLTATGMVLGTPEFMSPEQLRGKPLDPRTDVYSLALVTFEMLTGKLPFDGRTQQEMMIARLRSDPVPLRHMRPDLGLPATVERVLLKALAREPDQRYRGAPEFAAALAAAAGGQDVAPAAPPAASRAPQSGLLGRLFGR